MRKKSFDIQIRLRNTQFDTRLTHTFWIVESFDTEMEPFDTLIRLRNTQFDTRLTQTSWIVEPFDTEMEPFDTQIRLRNTQFDTCHVGYLIVFRQVCLDVHVTQPT